MKSAYERAMERFGGDPIRTLTDDQKQRIAEIDRVYQARLAQADLNHKERLRKAGRNPAESEQIHRDYTVECASLRAECERKKERVRDE